MSSGAMQHSVDRLTTVWRNISRTIWFTTTSRTPSKDSVFLHNSLIPVIGNAAQKFPTKMALPDLPETNPNTNPTHPSPTLSLAKVLRIPNRRTTPARRAQLPTRRSPIPTFPRNSGKMVNGLHRSDNAVLTTTFASFVALPDTSPRTVRNPDLLPPRPEHPRRNRTSPRHLARTRKKTEQSSRLRMTRGLR